MYVHEQRLFFGEKDGSVAVGEEQEKQTLTTPPALGSNYTKSQETVGRGQGQDADRMGGRSEARQGRELERAI